MINLCMFFTLKVLQLPEFAEFVHEDASAVLSREETDSIPIIDDIRYYITAERVNSFSDLYEVDRDLNMIEAFLLNLGLEA